jgi:hypothetical protein
MHLLRKNDEGIEVANWQRFLISQGYDLDADGDFGERTAKATRAFQASQNLPADGIVGDATFAAADKLKANTGSIKMPASGELGANNQRLLKVHPSLAEKAAAIIALAAREGFILQVSQGLRTFEEQNALFAKGRSRAGQIVTNARGGQSMHNFGLAVDFVFITNGKPDWNDALYKNIGRWAEAVGLEWGGNWQRFTDFPHVQLKNLPSFKVLLPIYNAGGLQAVWEKYQ